jgi:hypothetical protein
VSEPENSSVPSVAPWPPAARYRPGWTRTRRSKQNGETARRAERERQDGDDARPNRELLKDPDKIKIGQRLRIP